MVKNKAPNDENAQKKKVSKERQLKLMYLYGNKMPQIRKKL